MLRRTLLVFMLIAFLTPSSNAADTRDPWNSLMKAQCLKCSFGPGIATEWKGVESKSESDRFNAEVYLSDIDHNTGKARLIGNQGSTDITVILSPMGANFIEMTGAGNLTMITVYPDHLSGTEDFPAVWSRHLYLVDGPLPSQYFGTCKVWQ